MIGIDPLTLSSLLVLVSQTNICPKQEPTKINVIPQTKEVEYDYSQSLREIQKYTTDTVDPYGFHGTTVTQGFMRGSIELHQRVKFGQASIPRYDAACVWYDEITIELKIDPTIVIASELYKDRCMRKAIIGHELKHVRVDREVVNKYAKTMGKKLYNALKSRGFTAGPVRIDRMQEIADKMARVVKQVLELEYKKMGIEREERQRAVDTLEEYQSVDDKCPAFQKKKKQLYSSITSGR